MATNFERIAQLGQSIWCDHIRRRMFETGEMQALIDEGLGGMTSNPTIFQKAIGGSDDYDDAIRELVHAGVREPSAIYEQLVFDDIGRAADLFRPVYERRNRRDGFVSIEVEPALADDTDGTVARAREIFRALSRPNIMVKVPATEAGLPAITTLISEGVNVNVTLIFSVEVYGRVMKAYVEGLRHYIERGGDPKGIASVASFFVSRVDTAVDKGLQERIDAGEEELRALLGTAAVANTKVAYAAYQEFCAGPQFSEVKGEGARMQRPLWASTSTKNPAYRDTLYVDTLVGPNTVNTAPPETLEAIRRLDRVEETLTRGFEEAEAALERIEEAGVSLAAVTEDLRREGVRKFADSFDELMADIERKSSTVAEAGR